MSSFLLEFDRPNRRLVAEPREFTSNQQAEASAARVNAQRRVRQDHLDWDVVLVEAESQEALRETHGSFFRTLDDSSAPYETRTDALPGGARG